MSVAFFPEPSQLRARVRCVRRDLWSVGDRGMERVGGLLNVTGPALPRGQRMVSVLTPKGSKELTPPHSSLLTGPPRREPASLSPQGHARGPRSGFEEHPPRPPSQAGPH